jgi:hypothetical protein
MATEDVFLARCLFLVIRVVWQLRESRQIHLLQTVITREVAQKVKYMNKMENKYT